MKKLNKKDIEYLISLVRLDIDGLKDALKDPMYAEEIGITKDALKQPQKVLAKLEDK